VNPSGKLPITMEEHAPDNPAFASFPTDLNATAINYSEGLFVGYGSITSGSNWRHLNSPEIEGTRNIRAS